MAEPRPIGARIRTFDDLATASDEFLRQLAARVHIVDLAYAFGAADEALRRRLLAAVRPGLAEQIEQAISTVMAQTATERFPQDEQIRAARARVMEVAYSTLLFGSD